jgi:hypothetical protein
MPVPTPPDPTGFITYKIGSNTPHVDSLLLGISSYSVTNLAPGTHSVTTIYSVDTNWQSVTKNFYIYVYDPVTPPSPPSPPSPPPGGSCGSCTWRWEGSVWKKFAQSCTGTCFSCDPPTGSGTIINQYKSTDCY